MSDRCQTIWRGSRGHPCGARLEFVTNPYGAVLAVCPACERTKRGVCLDCPRPLDRRWQRRCASCAKARRYRLARRWLTDSDNRRRVTMAARMAMRQARAEGRTKRQRERARG